MLIDAKTAARNQAIVIIKLIIIFILDNEYLPAPIIEVSISFSSNVVEYNFPYLYFSKILIHLSQFSCQYLEPLLAKYHANDRKLPNMQTIVTKKNLLIIG